MNTARYDMFKKELQYVVDMMERNDPNGEWDIEDIAANPMVYTEILEQWKEDCGYSEPIPAWIDKCIDYLMMLTA